MNKARKETTSVHINMEGGGGGKNLVSPGPVAGAAPVGRADSGGGGAQQPDLKTNGGMGDQSVGGTRDLSRYTAGPMDMEVCYQNLIDMA